MGVGGERDALLGADGGPVPGWSPASRRTWQDTWWLYWYLANFATALLWGGVLASEAPTGDPAAHLAAYATCNGDAAATSRRRLLGASAPAAQLADTAAVLAVVACISAVCLGLGSVFLLRNEAITKFCVYGAIGLQIGVAAVFGLLCLFAGAFWPALFLLLYACVFAVVVWCYQSQLKLCCKLLSLAAHALADNLSLIPATLLSFLVGGAAIFVPLGVLVVQASRVGVATPVPGAVQSTAAPGTCVAPLADAMGIAPAPAPPGTASGMVTSDCCMFQLAGSALGFLIFAFFFGLWSLFVLFEVRSFVVAHVTARWYHQPRGVPLPGAPATDALRLALGPSSGSLCFGGAVLTCAELLRMLADAVQDKEGNIFQIILEAIVSCILNIIAEFLSAMTRFATIRVAITGDNFWEGAKAATDLFKRNLMNAVAVWSFPPMVLHLLCFTLSLIFAGITVLVFALDAEAVGAAGATGAFGASLGLLLFIGVALLFWVVLSYVSCILLNVVDTVYYCYALDVDKQLVTRNDVHELYELVPGVKVVSNPDGGMGLAGP